VIRYGADEASRCEHGVGLYVHVPFCEAKCGYCAFYSVPVTPAQVTAYVEALAVEARGAASDPKLHGKKFTTLYVGGGTPSAIAHSSLRALLRIVFDSFPFTEEPEVTVEANPESFSGEIAQLLASFPRGRVSLGAQSFGDEVLDALGRRHRPATVERAVRLARRAGVRNVSLDLIYGAPGEALRSWERTLERTLELGPEHVSCYCLEVEMGTPLARKMRRGDCALPDESLQAEMYDAAREILGDAGYEHYEISNFARSGHRCAHNVGYWARWEYVGLGPAAHSFLGEMRRKNPADLEAYCARVRAGAPSWEAEEAVSPDQGLSETIMLGLRTSDGIALAEVERQWGGEAARLVARRARALAATGLVEFDGESLRIPPTRFFVSSDITARLLAGTPRL